MKGPREEIAADERDLRAKNDASGRVRTPPDTYSPTQKREATKRRGWKEPEGHSQAHSGLSGSPSGVRCSKCRVSLAQHKLPQQPGNYGPVRDLLMAFYVSSGVNEQGSWHPCQLQAAPEGGGHGAPGPAWVSRTGPLVWSEWVCSEAGASGGPLKEFQRPIVKEASVCRATGLRMGEQGSERGQWALSEARAECEDRNQTGVTDQ